MSSTLSIHNPKFEAKLTNLPALRQLPVPPALGPWHKPIRHADLIDALTGEIDRRGYQVSRTQLATSKDGSALFGVIDLVGADNERGRAIGLRNSTDQSLAWRMVAGSHVFICDNLSMSGDVFAVNRKNTTGLDLGDTVARGFDKFLQHSEVLDQEISMMQARVITDADAKIKIYEIFAARVVPIRLFDDVNSFYFNPSDDMTDVQPRSVWGLHNAFTRAMRDLTPTRLFSATVALGKAFAISTSR